MKECKLSTNRSLRQTHFVVIVPRQDKSALPASQASRIWINKLSEGSDNIPSPRSCLGRTTRLIYGRQVTKRLSIPPLPNYDNASISLSIFNAKVAVVVGCPGPPDRDRGVLRKICEGYGTQKSVSCRFWRIYSTSVKNCWYIELKKIWLELKKIQQNCWVFVLKNYVWLYIFANSRCRCMPNWKSLGTLFYFILTQLSCRLRIPRNVANTTLRRRPRLAIITSCEIERPERESLGGVGAGSGSTRQLTTSFCLMVSQYSNISLTAGIKIWTTWQGSRAKFGTAGLYFDIISTKSLI